LCDGFSTKHRGDLVVARFQAGQELKFAHRAFGLGHAGSYFVDLSGNKVRLVPIDGELADRMNLVLQAPR
jgi:hypothetical protein